MNKLLEWVRKNCKFAMDLTQAPQNWESDDRAMRLTRDRQQSEELRRKNNPIRPVTPDWLKPTPPLGLPQDRQQDTPEQAAARSASDECWYASGNASRAYEDWRGWKHNPHMATPERLGNVIKKYEEAAAFHKRAADLLKDIDPKKSKEHNEYYTSHLGFIETLRKDLAVLPKPTQTVQ